jgi:hypothetical protein
MVTKFKIFENQNEYNIGDHVLSIENILICSINCFKIIYKRKVDKFQYGVEYINTRSEINQSFLFDSEIQRKSTPEEIEEFESMKSAIKYNL